MIKVSKIFKSFDKQIVLKDVSFHIKREGLYFIVGKSGVGKTTLLNIITKEDTEYKGKVKVSQDYIYFKDKDDLVNSLTVKDNLKLFELANKKKIEYYFDVQKLINKKVKKLSLGERQLVALLLALNSDKNIIFMDEPFSALSDGNIKKINEIIHKMKEKLFVIVSHNFYKFNNYTLINLDEPLKEKINGFEEDKPSFKKIDIKYILFFYKKTLVSKLIFILFMVLNIMSFIFVKDYTNEVFDSYFEDIIVNEGNVIYEKSKIDELNDNLFYEVCKKLAKYINNYNASYYSSSLYDKSVFIGNYYIDNGYTLSTFIYDEKVKENSVNLGINYNKFCKENKIINCNEDIIYKSLINKEIRGLGLKVDYIFDSEETVYIVSKRFYKTEDKYDYNLYYFDISKENIKYLFESVNRDDFLLNFNFIKISENEENVRYQVSLDENKKFNIDSLGYSKYLVCLDKGYKCNNYINKFPSLISVDETNDLEQLDIHFIEENLKMDEIVISSSLGERLNKKMGEVINLHFDYNNEYKKIPLVIKGIIDDEKLSFYHNEMWGYYFFRDYVGFKSEDLQINNLIVYDSELLDNHFKVDDIYQETIENIKEIFEKIRMGVIFVNGAVTIIGVFILIVLEKFSKFKKEYFNYLKFLGIKKECNKHS